jgi:peptidylprolyl isomerase
VHRRPRRLRRLPALLLLPLLLATTLVACGDDDGGGSSSDSGSEGLHGITISGDVGDKPKVEWDGELKASAPETTVVSEGDGEKVADGDQVEVNIWIGNGFTQKEAYTTYGEQEGGSPQTVTANDQLIPVFKDALLGQTIGSRVAVTASATDAFGASGNPQMGIGNEDSVLIVVDLMKMFTPPKPHDVSASKLPKVVEKNGEPVGFDFAGVAKPDPDGDLLRAVLKEGTGETVTTDMTVTADYLGMTYDAKKPFDESYSKDPVPFALTQVVKGWTYGLSGVKVGSRVLLQIPPELGYGAQAQQGIPANSTLYFVVDIRSAK